MHFTFTEEQELIRAAAHEFFQKHGASERVRAAVDSAPAYDEATWREMAEEMGWAGIRVPEPLGGSGLGHVELAILQQEAGRCLLPSPFFATVCLATPAIMLAGSESQQANLLPGIARGETRATVAMTDVRGVPGVDGITLRLEPSAQGYRLSGKVSYVIYGHVADLYVIAARAPGTRGLDGITLLTLRAGTPGVHVEKLFMMDLTRPMARMRFDDVVVTPDQILGELGQAGSAVAKMLCQAQIALAAEQAGGAQNVLELTTAFATQRVQFGRPIGSFQAVKHRLADMMVQVEAAKSAVYYAACVADEDREELAEAAAIAKACCSEAFMDCAGHMIQLHGGIGFTWEHDAHLYFKRARASATLLGTASYHRERLAQMLGLESAAQRSVA